MRMSIIAWAAAVTLGMALAGGAQAQQAGVKRTLLQTFDVPRGDYQTVIGLSEIGANQSSGRQSHPGPEGGYVLEGAGSILIDGQPPLELQAGQSYKLAPGAVHDVRGGPQGVKLVVTWVVQKDRPLVTPAN